MLSATVTVRELKNKETGLDLSITRCKEIPGMLGSSYEYHVVVVSRLPFFKSPKHKEGDVVQYMVPRKFKDFEELHTKMIESFSGTVLPSVPKKTLVVSSSVAKERQASLEKFLKFLATTPKLCTCSHLLQFLGVNAIKAGAYRKQSDKSDTDNKVGVTDEDDAEKNDEMEKEKSTEPEDLFEEDEEENEEDLFKSDDKNTEDNFIRGDFPDENKEHPAVSEAMLFDAQDLEGDVDFEKHQDLFVPGAVEVIPPQTPTAAEDDDSSEVLKIEDDLDKLLQLNKKVKKVEQITTPVPDNRPKPAPRHKPVKNKQDAQQSRTDMVDSVSVEAKTELSPLKHPKPAPRSRPGVKPASKPKPALAKKPPVSQKLQTSIENIEDNKNSVNPKPQTSDAHIDDNMSQNIEEKKDEHSDVLSTDDISKYIQENLCSDVDLDLFS